MQNLLLEGGVLIEHAARVSLADVVAVSGKVERTHIGYLLNGRTTDGRPGLVEVFGGWFPHRPPTTPSL
jgi:hypothetical protein